MKKQKMTSDELNAIVERLRAKAAWQLDGQRDQPLSLKTILAIEAREKIIFPDAFKGFLSRYGAGDLAFGHVYSPDRNSAWSLWDHFQYIPQRLGELLPFSDNGCGDYYCFPIVNGICEDRIIWADHEQDYRVIDSDYEDFRDFVAKVCLRNEEKEDTEQGPSPYAKPEAAE